MTRYFVSGVRSTYQHVGNIVHEQRRPWRPGQRRRWQAGCGRIACSRGGIGAVLVADVRRAAHPHAPLLPWARVRAVLDREVGGWLLHA